MAPVRVEDILKRLTSVRPEQALERDVVLIHVDSFYNITHNQPNLGVLYIATWLRENGFRVAVLSPRDLFEKTTPQLQSWFEQARPRLVGFYTMSDTIYQVATLAERIRAWLPGVKFIAGGPLASALGPGINRYFPFDYVVKGEGEDVTLAVAEHLVRGRALPEALPGLFYRVNGKVISGGPPRFIRDLDRLPHPDRSLVGDPLRFHVSTGRGCPYACTFCFQAVHGRSYRYRSARNVLEEVVANLERGHVAFDIIDDTFVANPRRVLEFCRLLKDYRERTGRDFVWYCEARVDILKLRPELLEAMKEAGLVRLQIGIESGDPQTLQHYEKRLKLEYLEELCRRVAAVDGISMYGNFIMGGPHETRATWKRSLDMARKLLRLAPGLFETSTCYLTPFPETPIYGDPARFGVRIHDEDFLTSLTLEECYCETESLSRPEIRRLRHEFMKELGRTMRRLVPRVPRDRIALHFRWAHRYGTVTRWYRHIFNELAAIREYFTYYAFPRFVALDQIPENRLPEYTPLRTIGPLQYDPRNFTDFKLQGSYRTLRLTDPVEKEVYALSCGKLPLGKLADELQRRLDLPGDRTQVLERHVLPALKKLEDHYQVIFHD